MDGTAYPHRPSVGPRSISAGLDYERANRLVLVAVRNDYAGQRGKIRAEKSGVSYLLKAVYDNSHGLSIMHFMQVMHW